MTEQLPLVSPNNDGRCNYSEVTEFVTKGSYRFIDIWSSPVNTMY